MRNLFSHLIKRLGVPVSPDLLFPNRVPLILLVPISQLDLYYAGIIALRKKLWEEVPGRDHNPAKVFSHGNHDDDTKLLVLGHVEHTHHAGHSSNGDWVAHVKLVKDELGKVQCSYYQIMIVTVPKPVLVGLRHFSLLTPFYI